MTCPMTNETSNPNIYESIRLFLEYAPEFDPLVDRIKLRDGCSK